MSGVLSSGALAVLLLTGAVTPDAGSTRRVCEVQPSGVLTHALRHATDWSLSQVGEYPLQYLGGVAVLSVPVRGSASTSWFIAGVPVDRK